jgi:hypothetical protein
MNQENIKGGGTMPVALAAWNSASLSSFLLFKTAI